MLVNANLVVISVDMSVNKTYVLSQSNEKNFFLFPSVTITNENKNVLEEVIVNKITGLIDCHELELFPQIISHHEPSISDANEELNMVFGFLVTYKEETKNDNYEWVEFDFSKEETLNNTIYRTIQRLK